MFKLLDRIRFFSKSSFIQTERRVAIKLSINIKREILDKILQNAKTIQPSDENCKLNDGNRICYL